MNYHVFSDFDDYASAVNDVDCRFLLRNQQNLNWSLSHVDLDGISVQMGREGGGTICEGQSHSGGYFFFTTLEHADTYSANTLIADQDSFLIMEPGCEFCISTKVPNQWLSVFVPTSKVAYFYGLEEPLSDSGKTARIVHPPRHLAHRFRDCSRQIMTAAASCPHFAATPAAKSAVTELLRVTCLIHGHRGTDELNVHGRKRIPRKEIVRRTKLALESHEDRSLSIFELAVSAGVSERTLRNAFVDYFGIGPAHYLRLRQLCQVQKALRAADPASVSVSDVLTTHGVWELGRFAQRYRQLFGKLPSETLRLDSTPI